MSAALPIALDELELDALTELVNLGISQAAHSLAEMAREEVTLAYQELKKFEVAQSNRKRRAREEANRREQIVLDEIGIEGFRRRSN